MQNYKIDIRFIHSGVDTFPYKIFQIANYLTIQKALKSSFLPPTKKNKKEKATLHSQSLRILSIL